MNPYVLAEPSIAGGPHKITVRNADGIDAVEVVLKFPPGSGPEKALALFARAAIEVVVHAREDRDA